jgi:RecA/RadA recombinase
MAKDKNALSPEEILAMMKSEFKKDKATLLSEEGAGDISKWVDMQQASLNYIISGDITRGFPYGRVVEYYGDNSTGKTLIALKCVATAQEDVLPSLA